MGNQLENGIKAIASRLYGDDMRVIPIVVKKMKMEKGMESGMT